MLSNLRPPTFGSPNVREILLQGKAHTPASSRELRGEENKMEQTEIPRKTGLSDLSYELILRIVKYLEFEKDINSFAQINKRFYSTLNSHLYQHNIKHWDAIAFGYACKSGELGAMRKFCDEGVSNIVSKSNWEPLALAAEYGHEDIVRIFIQKIKEDPELKRSWVTSRAGHDSLNSQGPLETAVKNGHEGVLRVLMSYMSANYPWIVLFFLAIKKGHEGIARLLVSHMGRIKYSVRTTYMRPYVRTILYQGGTVMESAVESGNLSLVRMLVEELGYKAEPAWQEEAREPTYMKMTPLGRAANKGYADIAQYLLKAGADPNATNPETWNTVLGYAVSGGHLQTARLLIEHGANPDPHVSPPVHSMVATRLSDYPLALAGLKGDQGMVNLLLGYIDLNGKVEHGSVTDVKFLVPIAAACGLESVVQRLLEKGCDASARFPGRVPNDLDAEGDALSFASKFGHVGIVRLLLDHGARPHGTSKDERMRPLATAVKAGHPEVVELLLNAGANPNSLYSRDPQNMIDIEVLLDAGLNPDPDNSQDCPMLVVAAKSEAAFRLLLSRGANPFTLRFPLKSRLIKEVLYSENVSVLRALLSTQLDLPIYNTYGVPYFFVKSAAKAGGAMLECLMEYLLSRNGPRPRSEDLYQALASAIQYQRVTSVELLLRRYGLELKTEDMAGYLTSAAKGFDATVAEDMLDALLQHGADINARKSRGTTCLSMLINDRNLRGTKLVLERGADYLSARSNRENPMSAAIGSRNGKMLELVLRSVEKQRIPLKEIEPDVQQAQAELSNDKYFSPIDHLELSRALQDFYWRQKYPVP